MPRPIVSPLAENDLVEIGLFIARDKPLAAEAFIAKIEEQFQLLADHPGLGETQTALGKGVRRLTLGNYLIFFRHREETVEILRVLQGSRDIRSLQ